MNQADQTNVADLAGDLALVTADLFIELDDAGVDLPTATTDLAGSSDLVSSADLPTVTGDLQSGAVRIMHLRFDESDGATAIDSTGHGHTGTLSSETERVTGKYGSAVSFNGDGEVTVPDSDALDPAAGLTVAAWVTADSLEAWASPLCKSPSLTTTGYGLFVSSTANQLCGILGNQPVCSSFAATSTFRHVAFTWDGNATLRLYFDGVLASGYTAPSPLTAPATTAPLEIGRCGESRWHGLIDEVVVFDRRLDGTEVGALYTNG